MAALLPFDVIEQILVLLDVKDLIRFKSVCKSWYYSISSPPFVESHLKHSHDNDCNHPELLHRRIYMYSVFNMDYVLCLNLMHIVGSANGLVCVSPKDAQLVVTNPSTREYKELPNPPLKLKLGRSKIGMVREVVCWGFGYDSSAADYKVIVGFRERIDKMRTFFYVFTLKSNVWKVVGQVNYRCYLNGVDGILYGGALHWFMSDANKRVIISLELSTEEFKEIPQPTDEEYYRCHKQHICGEIHECDQYVLGVSEECLCIYSCSCTFSYKKWIMKNNKWESYNGHCDTKHDVIHAMLESQDTVYGCDDGVRVESALSYMRASIFVKSLVSPHPHIDNTNNDYEGQAMQGQEAKESVENDVKGKISKKKKRSMRRNGFLKHMKIWKVSMMKKRSSCKHKTPLIWI